MCVCVLCVHTEVRHYVGRRSVDTRCRTTTTTTTTTAAAGEEEDEEQVDII